MYPTSQTYITALRQTLLTWNYICVMTCGLFYFFQHYDVNLCLYLKGQCGTSLPLHVWASLGQGWTKHMGLWKTHLCEELKCSFTLKHETFGTDVSKNQEENNSSYIFCIYILFFTIMHLWYVSIIKSYLPGFRFPLPKQMALALLLSFLACYKFWRSKRITEASTVQYRSLKPLSLREF